MRTDYFPTFSSAIKRTQYVLLNFGQEVDAGMWQGVPTEGRPDLQTRELMDVHFTVPMPRPKPEECAMEQPLFMLRDEIQPNLPWADDHFEERVSRVPSNPGEQYKNWPWWRGQEKFTFASSAGVYDKSQAKFMFDHTYQERFWPTRIDDPIQEPHGIRYSYGDLDDVVGQLLEYPHGRQAYFPIWFPEDTGNVHRGRVPCSLGYFFMLRNNQLHMWYTIRSCDLVRHFRDDLYLAARLQLWVLDELRSREEVDDPSQSYWYDVTPGLFHFHCFSLHMHKGDAHHVHDD